MERASSSIPEATEQLAVPTAVEGAIPWLHPHCCQHKYVQIRYNSPKARHQGYGHPNINLSLKTPTPKPPK